MCFCEFLNSNAAATISSAILSALLLYFTVRTSKQNREQQRIIHNRDILIAREQRIFKIYHTFTDCGRILEVNGVIEYIRLNLIPDMEGTIKKITEGRVNINKALDEATLICPNDPLIGVLSNIRKEFLELSEIELHLFSSQSGILRRACEIIRQEFPAIQPFTIQNIFNNEKAFARLGELTVNPDVEKYAQRCHDLWQKSFSYENFDKYFEKFIVQKDLGRKNEQ